MSERLKVSLFRDIPVTGGEQARNCCTLWRAVLDQMLEDLLNEPRNDEEHDDMIAAQFWLENKKMYNAMTPGFDDVCDLANLPPEFVRDKMEQLL